MLLIPSIEIVKVTVIFYFFKEKLSVYKKNWDTILYVKFTHKRNFPKSAVKLFSEDYCSKLLRNACLNWNRNYVNETEGYSMGSKVILADIHVIWTKNHIVKVLIPVSYKRYADDIQ